MESLATARRSLRLNLDRSLALSSSLDKFAPRLTEIQHNLSSYAAAVRPIRADSALLSSVGGHIDRAAVPAAAVLKVFDAVHGLEPSLLSDPRQDLLGYLSVLQRLQEALKFLCDNCSLAVQWLDDIVDYLDDNQLADANFLNKLKSSLKFLKENPSSLDGGLLDEALSRLESEYHRLLQEHSVLLPMVMSGCSGTITASPLPVHVIHKLGLIMKRMIANGRLDRCIAIYIEVRGRIVRESLKALDLEYLDISVSDFDNVQSIEGYIEKWGRHLEFAVKHLFEAEYNLCTDVFEKAGSVEVWMGCFAEIAAQAGILAFLRFGKTVCESKKDPIKLLKLLDMFNSLSKLRLDFNRLFGGKACAEIQNETRELIRNIVEGSCEIFWELLVQVELQRQAPPPSDGAVPKLVVFITDYCNKLIGDDYRSVLMQVLSIHRSWKKQVFHNRLLIEYVLDVVTALEVNLETWSKGYEDQVLSYLFMMNTHWHFFKHLKNTKLGELLGDSWLRGHEQYKEYWVACYLRESWANLPSLLSREGLIFFSGGRATARDLVKKRLKSFNGTFDAMYKKQSKWAITDRELREKTCQLIIQTTVPIYRSFIQNYGPLVEQDASKYVKYTVQEVEKMLGSLFQQKPKAASFRHMISNGTPSSIATASLYRSAPIVN